MTTLTRPIICAAMPHLPGLFPRIDRDMATGARTMEAILLRIVRERGTWAPRTAFQLESAKRPIVPGAAAPDHYLCR